MSSAQFLETAVSLSIQTAIVVTATAGLCRVVQHRSDLQSRLWAASHGVLLLLVAAALMLPHLRIAPPWPLEVTDVLSVVEAEIIIGRWLMTVWLIGVAISLGITLRGWWYAVRCLNQCVTVQTNELDGLPIDVSDEIRNRKITLLAGAEVAGPCCWQFHRPYILLPTSILSFDGSKLSFVLRHELAHLDLGHPLQLFLQRLVEALFWFHPFVWWSSMQAALTREFACDEAVIGSKVEVVDYLKALLAVLEQNAAANMPSRETLPFGAGTSVIARRAHRLTMLAHSPVDADAVRTPHCWGAFVALLLCGLVAASVWAPVDVVRSSRSLWSPWPKWTAATLLIVGVSVRDYEAYDPQSQLYELRDQSRRPR